jgi:hypothetical protein
MTRRAENIVSRSEILRSANSLIDNVCNFLTKDRPLKYLLGGSLLVAIAYCGSIFDLPFLLGTSSFWTNPRGLIGDSWADISTALSGYAYFQRDTWQLPLFHVSKLGAPAGINIIFTDSIPWVALAGRLLYRITGTPYNLYGLWTALCFLASAMSMTVFVAKLGHRNMAAAGMATLVGLCMPALLIRWGHMSLLAQFEIVLALVFYLMHCRSGLSRRFFMQAAGLLLLSLGTHSYIFAMICGNVAATILQSLSNRTLKARGAMILMAGLGALVAAMIALMGHLQSRGGLSVEGFGIYSLNLLAPFFPQRSGLMPALKNAIVDGTGGQYEGFSYLGGGVLLLLVMTLPWQLSSFVSFARRHTWLFALFLALTMFALSDTVYFGTARLFHLGIPERIVILAATFRSTGRFFWPVMYCISVLAIIGALRFYGSRGVLLLCIAALLQWIDSGPLREALAAKTSALEPPHINLSAWRSAIRAHDFVRVLPEYYCIEDPRGWNSNVAVQLQLLAAFENKPINSVYAARYSADCDAEEASDGMPRAGSRTLSVTFDEFPGYARLKAMAGPGRQCESGPGFVVCSDIPSERSTLSNLVKTDRP